MTLLRKQLALAIAIAFIASSSMVAEAKRNRPFVHPSQVHLVPLGDRPIKYRSFTLADVGNDKEAFDLLNKMKRENHVLASSTFIVNQADGLERRAFADFCDRKPQFFDDRDVFLKELQMENTVIDFNAPANPVFVSDMTEAFNFVDIWTNQDDLTYIRVNQSLSWFINRGGPSPVQAASYNFGRERNVPVSTVKFAPKDPRVKFNTLTSPSLLSLKPDPANFPSLIRGIFKQGAANFQVQGTVGTDFNFNKGIVMVCLDLVKASTNVQFTGFSGGAGSAFAIVQQSPSVAADQKGNLNFGSTFKIPSNNANFAIKNLGATVFDVAYTGASIGTINIPNLSLDANADKDSKFVYFPSNSKESIDFFSKYYIRGGIPLTVTVAGRAVDANGNGGSTSVALANTAFRDYNFQTQVQGPTRNYVFVNAKLDAIGDASKARILGITLKNPLDVPVNFQSISFKVVTAVPSADGTTTTQKVIATGSQSLSATAAPGASVPVPEITLTADATQKADLEDFFLRTFKFNPTTNSFNTELTVSLTDITMSASFANSPLSQTFNPIDVTNIAVNPNCRSGRCKLDTKIFVAEAAVEGTVDDNKIGVITLQNPSKRPITVESFSFDLKLSNGPVLAKGSIVYTQAPLTPLALGATGVNVATGEINLTPVDAATFATQYKNLLKYDGTKFGDVTVEVVNQRFTGQSKISDADNWKDLEWTPVVATNLKWKIICKTGSCVLDPLTFATAITIPGIDATDKIADLTLVNPSGVPIKISSFTFDFKLKGGDKAIATGSSKVSIDLPVDAANPPTTPNVVPGLSLAAIDATAFNKYLANQYEYIQTKKGFPVIQGTLSNFNFKASSTAWSTGKAFEFNPNPLGLDFDIGINCVSGKCVLDQFPLAAGFGAPGRDGKRVATLSLKNQIPDKKAGDLTVSALSFDVYYLGKKAAQASATFAPVVVPAGGDVKVTPEITLQGLDANGDFTTYDEFYSKLYTKDANGKFNPVDGISLDKVTVVAGKAANYKNVVGWIPTSDIATTFTVKPDCKSGGCNLNTNPLVVDVTIQGTDDADKIISATITNIDQDPLTVSSITFNLVDKKANPADPDVVVGKATIDGKSTVIAPKGTVSLTGTFVAATTEIEKNAFEALYNALYTFDEAAKKFNDLAPVYKVRDVKLVRGAGFNNSPLDSINVPIKAQCVNGKCKLESTPAITSAVSIPGTSDQDKFAAFTVSNPATAPIQVSKISFTLAVDGKAIASVTDFTPAAPVTISAATAKTPGTGTIDKIPLVKADGTGFDDFYNLLYPVKPDPTKPAPKVVVQKILITGKVGSVSYTFAPLDSAAIDVTKSCVSGPCIANGQPFVTGLTVTGTTAADVDGADKEATIAFTAPTNPAITVNSLSFSIVQDGTTDEIATASGTSAPGKVTIKTSPAFDAIYKNLLFGDATKVPKLVATKVQVKGTVGTGAEQTIQFADSAAFTPAGTCESGKCTDPKAIVSAVTITGLTDGTSVGITLSNPDAAALTITDISFDVSATVPAPAPAPAAPGAGKGLAPVQRRGRLSRRADIVIKKLVVKKEFTINAKSTQVIDAVIISTTTTTSTAADIATFFTSVFTTPVVNKKFPDVNIKISNVFVTVKKGGANVQLADSAAINVVPTCTSGDCTKLITP
ncbi:hypothetical protein HDU97_006929 [Phlyctochytrium planicorne]|nr:hypothetical protein HDU97_006929 [Phlyctochytrium planicorne]